jgi:predicted component of type VI protein secretion system
MTDAIREALQAGRKLVVTIQLDGPRPVEGGEAPAADSLAGLLDELLAGGGARLTVTLALEPPTASAATAAQEPVDAAARAATDLGAGRAEAASPPDASPTGSTTPQPPSPSESEDAGWGETILSIPAAQPIALERPTTERSEAEWDQVTSMQGVPDESWAEPPAAPPSVTDSQVVRDFIRSLEDPAASPPTPWPPAAPESGGPSAPPVPWLHLEALTGPVAGQSFELGPSGANLGRSRENSIHIRDERLSRHHARIGYSEGGYYLADLDSSNGTFVNGDRLQAPRRLDSGDTVEMGETLLQVTLRTETDG